MRGPRRRASRPGVERCEDRLLLATFLVETALDNGDDADPTPGSLRAAILRANAAPGADLIRFAIGSGPQSIAPPVSLPPLTDPVVIDGTTQPGFDGIPLIELNGAGIGDFAEGLRISTGQSTIRGLAINRFSGAGIALLGDGNRVVGNFIGTDRSGTLDFGNGGAGIAAVSSNNSIGGPAPADGNLVSGNDGGGIALFSSGLPGNNVIQGNRIGTDAFGTRALGNGAPGVRIFSSQNAIGGVVAGQGNTIAFNGGPGVQVGFFFTSEESNAIRGNSIFSNGGLGIDLAGDGVTPNDPGDLDGGPNRRQNFPVIETAFPSIVGTAVQGRLDSRPGSSYSIDLFASDVPDPSGFGEGRTYLGSTIVTTDADGRADFAIDLPSPATPGQFLTATATDAFGNTSEFSEARLVADAARADLLASLSAPSFGAQVGEELTVSATVTNRGPARATGATLGVPLPAGFDFVAAQASRGTASFADGVVRLALPTLLPGQSASLTIRAIPRAAGVVGLSATAAAPQADPDPENNNASTNVDVQPPVPADLSIGASVSTFPAIVGQPFEYTAVVFNEGPNARAEGVVVTTELPEGVELVAVAASRGTATRDGRIIRVDLGDLPIFANAVVRLTLRATAVASIDLSLTVRADQPDPNALNNFVRTAVPVVPAPPADVSVAISAAPFAPRVGETASFSVNVANNGPGVADEVVLTADLPAGAGLVTAPAVSQGTIERSGDTLIVRFGTLEPGQQAILSFAVRPDATGVLNTVAVVSTARPDPNPGNNRAEQALIVRAADPADLAIGIVAVPEPARVGQPLRYSIVAANGGPAEAVGAVVRVPLPSGVELTGLRPSQGSASIDPDGVLTIDLGTLAPGGRALIDVTVTPRALGPLEVVATIEGSGPDFEPTNNRAVSANRAVPAEVPPTVSGQRLVSSPRGITAIVLAFSRPLDPAFAALASNYAIRMTATDGRAIGRAIAIRSASYDPVARTVTLVPSRPLPLGRFFRLQANAPGGPGLIGVDGAVLDGDFNGLPDGIYEDLIGRGTPTRPRRLQRGPLSRDARPSALPAPLPPAPQGPARALAAARLARPAEADS